MALASAVMFMVLTFPAFAAPARCDVAYRLTPRLEAEPRAIDVELAFDAGRRTRTELRVPESWAGVADYAAGIVELHAAKGQLLATTAPGARTVTHRAGERIVVRYRVISPVATAGGKPWRDHADFYRVLLYADAFHFFGQGVFVLPKLADGDPAFHGCVTVTGVTPDAPIVTSFGTAHGPEATFRFHHNGEQLRDTLWLGGRLAVARSSIAGRPVVTALYGTWPFAASTLSEVTTRIIAREREFWRDLDHPYFAVSLVPNHAATGSYGGTAVYRAFAMHSADDARVPGEKIETLIGHEYLHTWIPARFGSMGGEDEEPLHYWFSEGFTDFYTHRLRLRADAAALDAYAAVQNERIRGYLTSPVRNADNRVVQAEFYRDTLTGELPYRRGEFLALRWDRLLRAKGKAGVDAMMRKLMLPARIEATADSPRATARLLVALGKSLGAGPAKDVQRFIERGETFEFDARDLGPCFTMTVSDQRTFALGFERRSLKERTLRGVDPEGPAHAAGARDGQAIAGLSLRDGDVTRDVVLKVMIGGVATPITYRPLSRESIAVPVYSVRTDALADPACRAWLPQ